MYWAVSNKIHQSIVQEHLIFFILLMPLHYNNIIFQPLHQSISKVSYTDCVYYNIHVMPKKKKKILK
jgi:hypothetical protein